MVGLAFLLFVRQVKPLKIVNAKRTTKTAALMIVKFWMAE